MTCQNIEDNNLLLSEYNCQIPVIKYRQHLDKFIPLETSLCTGEVVKNAIDLIKSKAGKCKRSSTCEMTRFTF